MNALASLYSNTTGYFLVAMVTGTVYGPMSEILMGTQRRFVNLAVPLLPLQDSILLAENQLQLVCGQLKILLSDIGGVPRFVWLAINEAVLRNLSDTDTYGWADLRAEIKEILKDCYGFSIAPTVSKKIVTETMEHVVRIAILRKRVYPHLLLANNLTLRDLENQGKLFFSEKKKGRCLVWLPLLHLECLCGINPALRNAVGGLMIHS